MQLAIIGCGQMAEKGHIPALGSVPDLDVVALVDPSEGRTRELAERLFPAGRRPECFTSVSSLLEKVQVDAALVATPPSTRHDTLRDLLAAGVHVLCEKPYASTGEEADELLRLLDGSAGSVMMCHNYAFFPEFLEAGELISSGAVGRVLGITIQCLGSYPWNGVAEYRPGWRYDPKISGGGRLLDTGMHALYLAQDLVGEPLIDVVASARFMPEPPVDRECFTFFRGARTTVSLAVGEGHGPVSFDILGEDGRVCLAYPRAAGDYGAAPAEVRLYRSGELIESRPVSPHGMITPGLYGEWLRRIAAGDRPYRHSAQHGRDLLHIVLATYRAALEGTRQLLPGRPAART